MTFINRIQEVIQKYKLEPVEKLMEQPKSKEESVFSLARFHRAQRPPLSEWRPALFLYL